VLRPNAAVDAGMDTLDRWSKSMKVVVISLVVGLVLICGGVVTTLVLQHRAGVARYEARHQLMCIGMAVTDYFDSKGELPPSDYDYRPGLRKHLSEPLVVSDVSWKAELDYGSPKLSSDNYIYVTVTGRMRNGKLLSEFVESDISPRQPVWVYHMRWYRPDEWVTERQCADALAQMVWEFRHDKGKWPGTSRDLARQWLYRIYNRSKHAKHLSFQIAKRAGKPDVIDVTSQKSRLVYGYSSLGPDVDDRVTLRPAK
jgi:hypothetical protein